ncbi:hypothetical protein MCT05_06620 [Vibrio aestuarianus]|nr:hypothetical protein [Vibrio aestuarianus]
MKISLILATIGRKIEVNDFLNSINNSQVRKFDVEVIVVDQNKDSSLDEIISQAKKNILV